MIKGQYWKGKHFSKEHKEKIRKRIIASGAHKEDMQAMWKGDNVGYVGLHNWVRKWKGTPSLCENCGTTEAKKFEWANVDHKYNRILEDYIRMCTSCHRKYDNLINNNQQ